MKLSDFDYSLDPSLIAQFPAAERDRCRLLVLSRKTDKIQHQQFYELIEYLESGDLLILNDSKVLAARLYARKESTGGGLQLLLIRPVEHEVWLALISGNYRIGQRLLFEDESLAEIVEEKERGQIYVKFYVGSDFFKWLDQVGRMPLPPYIKRSHTNGRQEESDRLAYQTVYAAIPGSVAAPTAGLHFSQPLLDQIRAKGIGICSITLHVGPGTFRPVRVSKIERHTMESEFVQIPYSTAMAIRKAKESGKRIVAVGTTVVRALESAALLPGGIDATDGQTDLFIVPGYRFKVIDALITNFHLPCSTLLMLVSALTGRERLLAVYGEALRERYRFYSFGDAMLIL
jgi:S-adenosylmethionine:tRNA ribosyltransferase-isomerase